MRKNSILLAALLTLAACGSASETVLDGEEEAEAGAETATFVNSRENARSQQLREHYVDFSFDHPTDWIIDDTPGESNYVRIRAPQVNDADTLIFHAGFSYGSGVQSNDYAQMESLIPTLVQQFSQGYQNFRLLERETGPIGEENGPGFTFEATLEAPLEHVRVYGRADIILPQGMTKGLFMVSIATSESGVTSPDEIAERPEFQMIYNSLSIG